MVSNNTHLCIYLQIRLRIQLTTFSVPLTWTAPLSLCPIYLKLLVHVLSVVQKRWSIAQWLNLLEEGTNNYFPYIFTKIL